ncbi:MAG TPA: hypothetical protein VN688_03385 [Gemmataceae bacterium]|nr:hypothetical protein [Gemmataceae bacterium]
MPGLLADVNIQGHLPYLHHLLEALDLWTVLAELKLTLVTFPDLNLPRDLDDRSLWNRCQQDGWVLFTENRNHDGPDSLQATLMDSWQPGCLPVLTLSNKGKFEHSRSYAEGVATDVAELLFDIAHGQSRDQSRIYVPR